jgi:hypothetical protein
MKVKGKPEPKPEERKHRSIMLREIMMGITPSKNLPHVDEGAATQPCECFNVPATKRRM